MQLPSNINSADCAAMAIGRGAAREGQPVTLCPHEPNSREGQFWILGWASWGVSVQQRRAA